MNIALANLLKAALEEAGATVIMPRTDIGGEELQSDIVRAEIFNKYDCDIIYHFDTGGGTKPDDVRSAYLSDARLRS